VYAPAGRLIDSKDSIDRALEHRRLMTKSVNHGGWWGGRYNKDLEKADIEFLSKLKEIRHDRDLGLKLRVEEPRIQIYANSVDKLEQLVTNYFDSSWNIFVESVSGPADAIAESVLNSGAIIRKTDVGYRYKIIIRDGRYSPEVKTSLLNYLDNVGTENIKLSPSGRQALEKNSVYIWNMYLYTNDPSIVDFLTIICPGIVSNCHELVVVSDK